MNKQTVVEESDVSATPGTEVDDAQDLDSLLNEYDEAEPQSSESKEAKDSSPEEGEDIKSVVSYVKSVQERELRQQTEADVKKAVETIKDGFDIPLPDRVVRGVLLDMADQNPKFLRAWSDRHENPAGFNKVLKAIQAQLKQEFGSLPDKTLSDERNALASAVRGATKSTTVDEPDDLSNVASKSDAEFNKMLREMGL